MMACFFMGSPLWVHYFDEDATAFCRGVVHLGFLMY